ncbi:MAG: hypothetical protein IH949_07200 [Bacteroidetes bacterium]|nr:hypothetical protein [Bacteroidota bacterium]
MSRMTKEIEAQYHPKFKKRRRVTSFQLLALFYEGDFARMGYTNSMDRKAKAFSAAMGDVEKIELMIPVHRQANQELAERLGGRTLGSNTLHRFIKGLISRSSIMQWITGRKVFRLRGVADYIAGFDKETAMFIGMRDDIKLAELRDLIEKHGGISDAALFEYTSKLIEVFKSFEILASDGKIEFDDRDAMKMEHFVENFLVLRRESRTRQHKRELKERKGSKAQIWLELMEENRKAAREDDKSIFEKVTDKFAKWKGWFKREILNEDTGQDLSAARKFIKEQGMSNAQAKKYYASQGLATAASVLGSAYAAKEWADRGKGLARAAGRAGRRGASKIWHKLISPVGKYTVAKPLEYLVWRPTKFVGTGLGNLVVGAGRGAAKVVTFPFALAASLLGIKSSVKSK